MLVKKFIAGVIVIITLSLIARFSSKKINIKEIKKALNIEDNKHVNKTINKVLSKYQITLGYFKKKEDAESLISKIKEQIDDDSCDLKITKTKKGLYVATIKNILDKSTLDDIHNKTSDICIGSTSLTS